MNEMRLLDLPALRAQRRRLMAAVLQAVSDLAEFDADFPEVKKQQPALLEEWERGHDK